MVFRKIVFTVCKNRISIIGKGSHLVQEKLSVGIVGCGGISHFHIEAYQAFQDRFIVDSVCDVDAQKAQDVAQKYHVPFHSTEFEELCHRADLDVIDICTPPSQHFTQIKQALDAGKHVICEKPMVGSLREIDELMSIEKLSGKRIMPILQYRFYPGIQKLKLLVDAGIPGQLYLSTVEVAWRRGADYYATPWRGKWATELGGTLLSHAIHALDLMCLIAGPIKNVFARTTTLVNPIEVEDCAAVTFSMADGSLATLSVTLGSNPEITRHRFCFKHLTAESNTRPYTNAGDPWTFTADAPEVDRTIADTLTQFVPNHTGFEEQFRLFYGALKSGIELPVTMRDARHVTQIITAMYYSARVGQAVDLPLSKDHPMYNGWAPQI